MNDLGSRKRDIRTRCKGARDALTERQVAAWSAAITRRLLALTAVRTGAVFFVYVSTDKEVGTRALIDTLVAEHKTVAIPNIVDRTRMEARRFERWQSLRPRQLGILAPAPDAALVDPVDVVITPGLAFSEEGDRLGFGAGYYDRWFAEHPVRLRIALAFEMQIVDRLPHDHTDAKMDLIVTEQRVIRPTLNLA